jgi:hypothetical protein
LTSERGLQGHSRDSVLNVWKNSERGDVMAVTFGRDFPRLISAAGGKSAPAGQYTLF